MTYPILAAASLAFLAATLSGCGSSSSAPPSINGFYVNKTIFDLKSNSFAGLRVASSYYGNSPWDITFLGTDDGKAFWNVHGKWTDKAAGKFVAYFSHRGAAFPDLKGVRTDDGISWSNVDAKVLSWSNLESPDFNLTEVAATQETVGGFYTDPSVFKKGSFKGARMIADNYFPDLTFVGSDDGTSFWTIVGRWDGPAGQFKADFTPIGGTRMTGTLSKGTILWSDGAYWEKETIKSSASTAMVV